VDLVEGNMLIEKINTSKQHIRKLIEDLSRSCKILRYMKK
jgi:predicted nucleic acid-binding protein